MESKVSPIKMNRDQQQIRTRLLLQLGLIEGTPQASYRKINRKLYGHMEECHTSTPPSPRSCLRKQTSVLHRKRTKHVRFQEQVTVTAIPSHRDFDDETWFSIWNDPEFASSERARNRFEFWVDGGDWQHVAEEDVMIQYDGTLIHPATWVRLEPLLQEEAYYQYVTKDGQPERYVQRKLPSYRSGVKKRKNLLVGKKGRKSSDQFPVQHAVSKDVGSTSQDYPYLPHWKDTSSYL